MKKSPLALFLLFILTATSITLNAQTKKLENPFENNGNLDSQLNYLYKTSTNYKEYKVISKKGYSLMHKNVLDSLDYQRKALSAQVTENKNLVSEINDLKQVANNLSEELKTVSLNKNSITVFGISIYKTNYNLIIVIIFIVLLSVAAFFIYKFTNSNIITKEAKNQLEEVQLELESVQKSALKRQQELNRKLQDEIMKNSKS